MIEMCGPISFSHFLQRIWNKCKASNSKNVKNDMGERNDKSNLEKNCSSICPIPREKQEIINKNNDERVIMKVEKTATSSQWEMPENITFRFPFLTHK